MPALPKSVELARVRSQFQQWRKEGPGRGRIPDRLWRDALSLLHSHSLSTVCKELGLSPASLKRRRDAAAHSASQSQPPAFVELRAVELLAAGVRSAQAEPSSVCLAFTRPDGATLALKVPSAEWTQVEALCSAFLRG